MIFLDEANGAPSIAAASEVLLQSLNSSDGANGWSYNWSPLNCCCLAFFGQSVARKTFTFIFNELPQTSARNYELQKSAAENITKALSICIYSCFS